MAGKKLLVPKSRCAVVSATNFGNMVEIRIHGRGGQGVVTAADLTAMAAFKEGHYAQAFPSFGSERTGAPVVSFCRISDDPIRSREPVLEPDVVIIQDPTLLTAVDVFAGIKPDGYALINTSKSVADLRADGLLDKLFANLSTDLGEERVITVPASEIAREHVGRPLPNAALLGAAAAFTGVWDLGSVQEAIHQRFHGRIGETNAAAARAAYDFVKEGSNA